VPRQLIARPLRRIPTSSATSSIIRPSTRALRSAICSLWPTNWPVITSVRVLTTGLLGVAWQYVDVDAADILSATRSKSSGHRGSTGVADPKNPGIDK
jgi:hypothetical protein